MRVDGQRHVLRRGPHLDGEDAFGDELAGAGTADADAEHALALRVDHQLGDAVGAAERDGAAGCAPGELGDRHLEALLLRVGLGEAGPGDLGIGEHHGRNRRRRELDVLVAGNGIDGHAPLVRRLVRQHRLAGDVTDGVDRGLIGAPALVRHDEAAWIDLHGGLLESGDLRVRAPADRDEHAIEGLIARLPFTLKRH